MQILEYDEVYREEIINLILDIQNNEFSIVLTIDDQKDLLQIEEYYQRDQGNFWVAIKDQKVVGTISLLDIGNDQVALRKLFVKKECRGKVYNTASLLLDAAINWSNASKVKEIYLGTTSKYHAAHKFYEKHDFKEIEKSSLPLSFPIMKVDTKFYTFKI